MEYKVKFYKNTKTNCSPVKKTAKTPIQEIKRAEENYYDVINNKNMYE